MRFARLGSGAPLLLVHGLGGSRHSWDAVAAELARHRELIIVDLPGSGASPELPGRPSAVALADALEAFLADQGLTGIDAAGSSLGGRLVLELARRGALRDVVALSPGGFWVGFERSVFELSVLVSVRLLRVLEPLLPFLASTGPSRMLLLPQFSAHPWKLPADLVSTELQSFATARGFEPLLHELATGPGQPGAAWTRGRVTLGWGRQDRVCFPLQARRAVARFPHASLTWFDDCGHFPQWDQPEATVRLILENTTPQR